MPLPEPLAGRIERAALRSLSEMDTQRVIIEPLLAWLGFDLYDLDQVAEQVKVVGAGRSLGDGAIDYVVSVDRRPHLLIEAKKAGTDRRQLLADHASVQQIVTYCSSHHEQPRWGVLTNGLIWAIFDVQAKADVFSRCILTVNVQEEPELLRALSPAWRRDLERFANELNEARAVDNEGMRRRLISAIEREYRELFGAASPVQSAPPPSPARPSPPAPAAEHPRPRTPGGRGVTVSYGQRPQKGSKPTRLLLPDGPVAVRHWGTILVETANYLLRKGLLRAEVRVEGTDRILVTAGVPPANLNSTELSNGWSIVTNWSAADCVRVTGELLRACGQDANGFSVEYDPVREG